MSAPTRKFVSGLLPGVPWELPAAQGLRARRHWPSPRASSSAPRMMLLPSPSPLARCQAGDPREGSDAAQSGRQTASVRCPDAARVARPRAWNWAEHPPRTRFARARPLRFSKGACGFRSRSSPSSLDQLLGLRARCSLPPAADRSRRLSAPRGSPGPWLGHPPLDGAFVRRLAPPSILERGDCGWEYLAGSLCDAGLMRRAPGTRPPTLRHGPSRPCIRLPI